MIKINNLNVSYKNTDKYTTVIENASLNVDTDLYHKWGENKK